MERPQFNPEPGSRNRLVAAVMPGLFEIGSRLLALTARVGSASAVRRFERGFGRVAERLAQLDLDIDGLERVDPDEAYLVVSLHEGFADAVALLHLPLDLRFAARDELFSWPALGRVLRSGNHPMVEATLGVSQLRSLHAAVAQTFEKGDSLVVFAQGSILGLEVGFQQGVLSLARSFDRPLLPVVLTGSHRVWEHPFSSKVRLNERVSMSVLEPIAPGTLDSDSFRSLERHMKQLALARDVAPPRRFVPERDGWWDDYKFEIDPDFEELAVRVREHRATLRNEGTMEG